jgi:hypothetical protein
VSLGELGGGSQHRLGQGLRLLVHLCLAPRQGLVGGLDHQVQVPLLLLGGQGPRPGLLRGHAAPSGASSGGAGSGLSTSGASAGGGTGPLGGPEAGGDGGNTEASGNEGEEEESLVCSRICYTDRRAWGRGRRIW